MLIRKGGEGRRREGRQYTGGAVREMEKEEVRRWAGDKEEERRGRKEEQVVRGGGRRRRSAEVRRRSRCGS